MIKNIIKYIFVLLVLLNFSMCSYSYYDMSTPVEGDSLAENSLQFQVVKKIYKKLTLDYPSCYDLSVHNTQIVQYPYDIKKKKDYYVKGYWKELWTMDVCSQRVQIPVSFYIKGKKTVFVLEK